MGVKMSETNEIIGKIIDKSMKEGDTWKKYSFKIEKEDGKSISLGFFVKDEEQEKLANQFKEETTAKFYYYDTESNGIIYHNITKIEAISGQKTTAFAPTKVGELERQKLIVRQSCLSNALKYFEILKDIDKVEQFSPIQVKTIAEEFEKWVLR